jgi:prophage regulatory protein
VGQRRKREASERVLIRKPDVEDLTGYSSTTIWRLEKVGKFPQRVQLSENAVAWVRAEVLAWIQSRARRGGKQPPVQWRGGSTRRKAAPSPKDDPKAAAQPEAD